MISEAAPRDLVAAVAAAGERRTFGPPSGGRTCWRLWGEGPALMLLHGNFGSWTHWIRNIIPLAQSHRVLVPDMPGFGESDLPSEAQTAESLAASLLGDLDAIGVEAPHVVGFSFGATVAAALTQALAGRAASLTIVSTSAFGAPRADPGPLASWRHLTEPGAIEAAHRANLAALMFARPRHVDLLAVFLQGENARAKRLDTRRIAAEAPLRRLLQGQVCPVRAIFGAGDRTAGGSMAVRAALLSTLCPGARTSVVEDAGHWVQYEQPHAFGRALRLGIEGGTPVDAAQNVDSHG